MERHVTVTEVTVDRAIGLLGADIAFALEEHEYHSETAPHSPTVIVLLMGTGCFLGFLTQTSALHLLPWAFLASVVSACAGFLAGELRGLSRAFALWGATIAATWAAWTAVVNLATGLLAGCLS